MRRPDSFKEQQGYFTFAQNTDDVNYLELAYAQALSIKCTQEINRYAVAVDAKTKELITDRHRSAFDYIIDIKQDDNAIDSTWKLANEWQAWWLTPFKETVKLESDIMFNRNVDHWWHGMRHQEVCLTTEIRDYEGNISDCRAYRELFDLNKLPNVYNGFMYFRFGMTSLEFFNTARTIYQHWSVFKDEVLMKCHEETPTTDVVFAIAAQIVGVEKCTMPGMGFPSFVHMKGAINRLNKHDDWTKYYYAQTDDQLNTMIGFSRQLYPVHYYNKNFITADLIGRLENNANR